MQEQLEPLEFGRVTDPAEVETFIGGAAVPHRIQPQLAHVGDQHPARADRVVGVFPCLLHRCLGAPRHDRVEAGFRAFQLEGREDRRGIRREPADREIDGAAADGLLGLDRAGAVAAERPVTERALHQDGVELGFQL